MISPPSLLEVGKGDTLLPPHHRLRIVPADRHNPTNTFPVEQTEQFSASESDQGSICASCTDTDSELMGDDYEPRITAATFLTARRRDLRVMFYYSALHCVLCFTSLLMAFGALLYFGPLSFAAYVPFLCYGATIVLPCVAVPSILVLWLCPVHLGVICIAHTICHLFIAVLASISMIITGTALHIRVNMTVQQLADAGLDPWDDNRMFMMAAVVIECAVCVLHILATLPSSKFAGKYLHNFVYVTRRDIMDRAVLSRLIAEVGLDRPSEYEPSIVSQSSCPTMERARAGSIDSIG